MKANQPTWADVVKGKQEVEEAMAPEPDRFKFNAGAPEFALTLRTPPGLDPAPKGFDPSRENLLQNAAKMQSLLLECYSDSSDDETPCKPPRIAAASKGVAGAADAKLLNPFAFEFVPSAESNPAKAINLSCYSSDDELPRPSQRNRNARKRVLARKDMPSAPVAAVKVLANAALNPSAPEFSPPSGWIDQKLAGSYSYHPSNINFACYSSDDESPCPSPRPRMASKCPADDSDSTSEGKTSDSDAESLNSSDTL